MGILGTIFPLIAILVNNFWWVLSWRALLGLSLGFASAVIPMYSSTIVADDIKGCSFLIELLIHRSRWIDCPAVHHFLHSGW